MQREIEIAEKLADAITQRKPFKRFKNALLDYPHIREQWFKFENDIVREKICAWLTEHNLICRMKDENN